jgi:hypothetical protein
MLFSDGEDFNVNTGKIGQIKDIVVVNRGSDYITTPNVSLKIYDLKVTPDSDLIVENDIVYQGTDINTPTFKGMVDSYSSSNNILRVFNYSGTPSVGQNVVVVKTGTNNINAVMFATTVGGKTYPLRYGDGKAKANAEFLNGLIRYNGFYLNTDGQVSSDKKLQSSHKYHNFSYSLISEGSYSNYAKTILDVAHPAGTELIPVHVLKNDMIVNERANINTQAMILTSNSLTNNCNVGFGSLFVRGQNENFDTVADVNDLIVINSSDSNRMFTKVITGIGSQNIMSIESPCIAIGDGRASTNATNSIIQISGNSNPISYTVMVNDRIRFNLGYPTFSGATMTPASNIFTGVVSPTVSVTMQFPSTNHGLSIGNRIRISYGAYYLEGIIISSIDTQIIFNADYSSSNYTGGYTNPGPWTITSLVTRDLTFSVSDISDNNITLNTSAGILSSNTNLLYQVLPKLNVVDYLIIKTGNIGD